MGFRPRHNLVVVVSLMLVTAVASRARAEESPQEKQRRELMRQLGLKKKNSPAPTPEGGAAEPASGAEPPGAGRGSAAPPSSEPAPKERTGESKSVGPSFARAIHPLLVGTCKPCHSLGGAAAISHFILSGDVAADYHSVVRFVDRAKPGASLLLAKVAGASPHGGGALWPVGSVSYERMLAWIRDGAGLEEASSAEKGAASATPKPEERLPAERRAEEERRTLKGAPAPAPGGETPGGAAPSEAAPSAAEGRPATAVEPSATASGPSGPSFAAAVHPILMSACAVCHRTGGAAAMTRFLLSGDASKDEAVVRTLVDPRAPEQSLLLRKASGELHSGGAVLRPGDPRAATILAWVRGLAGPAPAGTRAGTAEAAPTGAKEIAPVPAPPTSPTSAPSPPGPSGLHLPLGFMLNGRFDLNYERRQFTGNPFDSASVATLRSYHHFLFLSRETGDPCGLTVEVLTLLFWEGHCRLPQVFGPVHVTAAAGKIVVPFGADPLFHQSYGGLAGFDQIVLPPVWSIEGVAAHAVLSRGELAFTDDLYVVRGYALQNAASLINLQNGFSPDDDTKLAVGNRVGVAWMGISAWYSTYFNPLGFGRRLFMQAIDLNIWRQRQIPVLGHFSLGAGLLRADVSGGGPGVGGVSYDYYDFADYVQLRYFPVDWLFLQYRTGIFTFDNRRGLILDNSRLTAADGSTHNFGIVARTQSLWFGIFYFVDLEKVNEIPNDVLRFNVTYEF